MSQPKKVHHFKAYDVTLTSVTVFNDRAEVKRTLNAQLAAGINENVSKHADVESLRVDGGGPAVIHDVQFQCKPALPEEGYSPRVKELEEERKKIQSQKESVEDRQKVLEQRVKALDEIVGGSMVRHPTDAQSPSFILDDESLQNLTKFFTFYEENSIDVRQRLRCVNEELRIIDEKLAKINNEIRIAQNSEQFAKHISVLLESAEGGDVELDVAYQVGNARWYPSYDIRIDSTPKNGSSMKLIYYGKIMQSTGEDWNDAPLFLSTAQPSLGGNIPEFGTQIVCLCKPLPAPQPIYQITQKSYIKRKECAVIGRSMGEGLSTAAPSMLFGAVSAAPVSVGDAVLSTVFVIARPATIPSDSSEHKVTITSMDMKPTMIHEVVPCKNTSVFLNASIINSSQFSFLPGQANVYLNNSFVAKSNIKAVSPNERFICSLGVDPAVKVEYKPAHKYTEQMWLLSKCSTTAHEQRIVVRNTKNEKVLLTIREHVPKSTDEKIKIKLFTPELDPTKEASSVDWQKKGELPTVGARLNSAHNLEWTITVEPNEETELILKWAVDYPNGETVTYREQF
ncbi:Protein F37C4.5 [Toxocara canis]|uniref:Protein F37C4.5 n=1 Tax=Toxocara canis TaxID=6265 RepID=A0A0B2VYJ6_TOXCA|nr:Protein F37C4.5 [Toxocara canis]